jgi:glutamate-5-semialdehyde dehydrogenase
MRSPSPKTSRLSDGMGKDQHIASEHMDVLAAAQNAKHAASILATLPENKRKQVLEMIADRLEQHVTQILEANKKDVAEATLLVNKGELSEALLNRLKLDSAKITDLVSGIRLLAESEDPLGKVTLARELDDNLNLYRITCPIGVIAVIFESRPDALPQIAALCLKSGNSLILKGGREAQHSNLQLFQLIQNAIADCQLPPNTITLLASREEMAQLLGADHLIDLVIPRGGNDLVRQIQEATRIPVLGHAEGICHIYVDASADLDRALKICLDSKTQYPSACNAVETILVHRDVAKAFLPDLFVELDKNGVAVRGDSHCLAIINNPDVALASLDDWSTEYCDLIVSMKVVDSLQEAIDHINLYGSGHTDSIVAQDSSASEHFFESVNSAGVFINASTRFSDGFRYGFGAEVGISTGKLHPRGPVGLEGLVTYKYKLVGEGHLVQDYVGRGARKFTHKPIAES